MEGIPNTLDEAIAQARNATLAALEAGYTRLQVEIAIPELKVMPVATGFLPAFAEWETTLRVFFPDAGAAALARRDWDNPTYPVRGIGELKAKIQPEDKLFVFIEPSAVEVEDVEKLCEEAGDRPVIMLSPRMEDIATIGIGYAGRKLRDRFLSTLTSCYFVQPLDGAAIFRCYPQPWQVWREMDGNYELLAETPQKPVGEALDAILYGTNDSAATSEALPDATPRKKPGLFSGLQQFLRALSQ